MSRSDIEREYVIAGYIIRQERERQGLRIKDLARKAKLEETTVKSIEHAHSRSTFHHIVRLFRALKINMPEKF